MRNLWRALPRLALPAFMGLGLAYLATGFLPRPAPALRPPEELRAHGQGLDEDSPVRAILERNVLHLRSTPFSPPEGQLPGPATPDKAQAAIAGPVPPGASWQAKPPETPKTAAPEDKAKTEAAPGGALSGGSSVLGPVNAPAPRKAP